MWKELLKRSKLLMWSCVNDVPFTSLCQVSQALNISTLTAWVSSTLTLYLPLSFFEFGICPHHWHHSTLPTSCGTKGTGKLPPFNVWFHVCISTDNYLSPWARLQALPTTSVPLFISYEMPKRALIWFYLAVVQALSTVSVPFSYDMMKKALARFYLPGQQYRPLPALNKTKQFHECVPYHRTTAALISSNNNRWWLGLWKWLWLKSLQ